MRGSLSRRSAGGALPAILVAVEKVHGVRNSGARGHKGLLDWCVPAIAGGRMHIRTPLEIICYDIRDRGGAGDPKRSSRLG